MRIYINDEYFTFPLIIPTSVSVGAILKRRTTEFDLGLPTVIYLCMRLWGGGVGHKATCEWDEILFQDAGWAVVKNEPMDNEDGTDVEEEEEDNNNNNEGELEAWGYTNLVQEDDKNLDEVDGYLGQGNASDSDEDPDWSLRMKGRSWMMTFIGTRDTAHCR